MPIIDEDGNLFGTVNVIDALAVLLILAVVVAGIAVVGVLSDGGESETRYATVDLGSQPDYVVDRVAAGDEMSIEGYDQNLTVTDVYATSDGNASQLTVRAALEGERIERDDGDAVFEFAGERLRAGDELEIETDEYVAAGPITSLDRDDPELATETTPVLLESTVTVTTATEITEGETFTAGPHTTATVTNVRSYPAGDDQRRVHVGLELETLRQGGSLTFGTQPLTIGSQVSLSGDAFAISGDVVRRGTTELQGEPESRYVTLDLGSQPDYIVDRVAAGDTMNVSDERLTVTDVHATPAGDGDGYLTVRAEVDGRLVETLDRDQSVYQFAGERLRVGDDLEIDVDDYVTGGQVTSLDREDPELDRDTTPVVLESTVSTTTADEIRVGDTFEVGPHSVATVATVHSYPTGDDQRRVHVGLELETINRGTTPYFAGQRVAVDNQLSLASDAYSLSGEIVRRGATEVAGDTGATTFELKLENVDPDVADGLEAGMTETERGETLATIQSVDSQPAEVVLESEDGNIYLREHPTNKDVRLTIEGQTVTTDSGVRFHGESLREGDDVTLDLGTMIVQGTTTQLDPDE